MPKRKRRGRGEGSVYQRADGVWTTAITNGYGADGRRRRRVLYGKTKGEVLEKLRDPNNTPAVVTQPASRTVQDLVSAWLDSKRQTAARSTVVRYESVITHHINARIGGLKLNRLEFGHVEGLLTDLDRDGVSARNRQLARIVIVAACNYGVRRKWLPYNPAVGTERPRSKHREMQVWDQPQISKFWKATEGDRLAALWVVALSTGMRQGELFALRWSDINFDDSMLTVRRSLDETRGTFTVKETKTGGARRIDLPPQAIEALKSHRKAMLAEGHIDGPVFCDRDGRWLRKSNVYRRLFQPAVVRAGLPQIRFHDMRHTHASLLLQSGVNVKVVAERLGHSSPTVTLNTYAHTMPTMQKAAAEQFSKLFG